jgi:DNA-binding NtrC family response regulator
MSTSDSAVGTDTPLATSATLPTLHSVVEDAERGHIRKALTHCDGSVGKTADVLGISRKTLWEKMKRLAISA